jgi:hypothetical protein
MNLTFLWAIAVVSAFSIGACTPTTPIFATLDLNCGDRTYTVSTGNNKGECQSSGTGKNAVCGDNSGNSAEVSCASGCLNAKGSGSCKLK